MNSLFYPRLAAMNIRKNAKIYVPYILTCIFTTAMFYIMLYITYSDGLRKTGGAAYLVVIMQLGSIVIGIFATVILLYTNSFLIKRRKKELGLFNILGMEKRHIAKVMAIENLYVALMSIGLGLLCGILLSKLMLMLLLKLLNFPVPFGFEVSPMAVLITAALFAAIFLLTLLKNVFQVHLSKPIELLHGGAVGEKEPKTKGLLAIVGALTLGAGYTIAIVTKSPLSALGLFFIAVILVIVGTYCLFTAGSIAALKLMRQNKKFYYKTGNFTTVSGMLYRMKQNAAGLANICILSTMVLVMISTTICMYFGMEDALRMRYPRNIEIQAFDIGSETVDGIKATVDETLAAGGVQASNMLSYRYEELYGVRQGTQIQARPNSGKACTLFVMPLSEYRKLQGADAELKDGELLVYSPNVKFTESSVSLGGAVYTVKEVLSGLNVQAYFNVRQDELLYLVVPDERSVVDIRAALGGEPREGIGYYCGFDTAAGSDDQITLINQIDDALTAHFNNEDVSVHISIGGDSQVRVQFLSMYGGLFFLGIFLGALFIMATVLIMYYKQISEGYDDKERFEIMQKVGMSKSEVRKAIRTQVLTVFFLPLAVAAMHILASFRMITRLLYVLNLENVPLFALCSGGTFLVFALLYTVVYTLTAKAYYGIVEA